MSLYDKSSLLQVPSLYKDGTLVSTIPEDRSGDFTVSRGSNLAATRIGPDGYIKKGYENLLLHSNSFLTNWGGAGFNLTPSQEGYNGTNDAWLMTSTSTGYASCRLTTGASISGVNTLSVYAKGGSVDSFGLRTDDGTTITWFELTGVGNAGNNGVIEPLDNDWYRCSVYVAGSHSSYRIYIGSSFGSYNVTIGDSIYIQDAQINQGLVAYPYLETTDAPAQGGLLENTPRLDWSNGVPSVLVEEQRTNDIALSEYASSAPNASILYNETTSPEGLQNAMKLTIAGVSQAGITTSNAYVSTNTTYTQSCYVKKDVGDYFGFGLFQSGMPINNNNYIRWNLSDITIQPDVQGSYVNGKAEDAGNGWIRLSATIITVDSGSRSGWKFLNMSSTSFRSSSIGDSFFIYGIQAEPNKTAATSYIPTYGTSQTRSNEVISDDFNIPTTATIYNSFYSDVAETVFVFDQVFNVVEGLNKVAIAFSPTAVKISVGGSIVANATGTYDTTSLTNIQLGSNNGTDYSNAPISGFYVFPEFLTDEELNSLTD